LLNSTLRGELKEDMNGKDVKVLILFD